MLARGKRIEPGAPVTKLSRVKHSADLSFDLTEHFNSQFSLNLLAQEFLFLILAHPVYKMWIIQEPNALELWNKLHFEEKKTESIYHV